MKERGSTKYIYHQYTTLSTHVKGKMLARKLLLLFSVRVHNKTLFAKIDVSVYVCTLCFIIRVLLRKKSNILQCIGQFYILRQLIVAMANAIFLSEGIQLILQHDRVISFSVVLPKIRNRVPD